MEVVLESLKCEVIVVVWLCAYPSCERLIIVWLSAYPSKCRGNLFCALPLVRGCISWERSCVLPNCICPKSSVEVPCVGSLCGLDSGNPSVGRRGCRAVCSNLETYLYVCVWSTFSNSLSLILCLASIHIVHSYLYAWYWLCVCLTCVEPRELI